MTDAATPQTGEPSHSVRQPGDILRDARMRQGLEIDSLAALIKVAPAKLRALEEGRHELLPDANFTRALAMTVCRSLKIDPAPVLAGLPAAKAMPLLPEKPALNQPFKESRGVNLSFDAGWAPDFKLLLRPQWLAPVALLVAALVVYLLPDSIEWPHFGGAATTSIPPVASAAAPASQPASVASMSMVASGAESSASGVEPAASAVSLSASAAALTLPVDAAASASPAASAVSQGAQLVLSSRDPAWIEVRDAHGAKLLSRQVLAGETVGVDGAPPLKLHIGNAMGIQVSYRGQAVDLTPYTRNNVARLELK